MPIKPHIQQVSLIKDSDAMRRGLAPGDLVDRLASRFDTIEKDIAAFLPEDRRFERLRRDAEALSNHFPQPATRPPLFGALLGVKDIFHCDGFETKAGTAVPLELFAGSEAAVVTRLKRAGALVVGKTVTTEFAYFEPGPTRNPHNLGHTPGGSSSGSAAAVAAGLSHCAIGTQTVGSVIRPAAYCGIVGYKPSFGRVDTAGLVSFSHSADHVGFFTQDVADMRLLAAVSMEDWDSTADDTGQLVLGVPDGAYLQQSTALDAFEAQMLRFSDVGYPIKRVKALDDIAVVDAYHQAMIAAELAIQHEDWFEEHRSLYRPRTAELIRFGRTVSTDHLQEAREHRLRFREQLHGVMSEHGIDLWICPAAPDVAPAGIGATGDPKMNMPWTHAGLPAITIPAGKGEFDLPLGLQLLGKFGMDEALLRCARDMERHFR